MTRTEIKTKAIWDHFLMMANRKFRSLNYVYAVAYVAWIVGRKETLPMVDERFTTPRKIHDIQTKAVALFDEIKGLH